MFRHVLWPLRGFETLRALGDGPTTLYPVRNLRYWFPRMFLEQLHAQLRVPLSVLEVGIGEGKMLAFMGGPKLPDERIGLPDWIERWDGLDVTFQRAALDRFVYTRFIEGNVEAACDLEGRRYHAVLLIHVLEHLFKPEHAMLRLLDVLYDRGRIIGGSPTMPDAFAYVHEPLLRWKHRDVLNDATIHRHISVMTPGRVKRFARRNRLKIDHLAGAFFLRASGLCFENSGMWLRSNLLWGAMFPSLGAELYFSVCRNR